MIMRTFNPKKDISLIFAEKSLKAKYDIIINIVNFNLKLAMFR